MAYFPPRRNFSSLSIKDLLDARDAYHVHLAHYETVIGTAIGRYLLRPKEAKHWRGEVTEMSRAHWRTPSCGRGRGHAFSFSFASGFRGKLKVGEKIPDVLYLGDGRAVPTCVVYAPLDEGPGRDIRDLTFRRALSAAATASSRTFREREHVGSLGCLASDGDMTYAVTSRHVTGEPGREIYSIIRGKRQRIGVSDSVQVRHLPFSDVYPGWPGDRVYVTMDVGLVRIDDITDWTAQVYGIGELGDVADLNVDTISLDLMGCPVRAFGSVSGLLEGKVKGLFYRYRSKGGFDYVADVLIGPRRDNEILATRPGDSGTLWVFDPPTDESSADAEEDSFSCQETRPREDGAQVPAAGAAMGRRAVPRRAERESHAVRAGYVRQHGIARPGDRRRPLLEHRAPRILGKNRALQDRRAAQSTSSSGRFPTTSKLRKLLSPTAS